MLPDFLERPPEPPSPLLGKGAMHTYPRDAEGLRDGRGAMSNRPHLTHPLDRDGRFAAFKIPLAFPASIPACCRSRMNLRSISAPIPSTVTRIGPAASSAAHNGPLLRGPILSRKSLSQKGLDHAKPTAHNSSHDQRRLRPRLNGRSNLGPATRRAASGWLRDHP